MIKYSFKNNLFFLLRLCHDECTIGCLNANSETTATIRKESDQDVIAAMTLEEKTKLVVGTGFDMPGNRQKETTPRKEKVPGAAGSTYAIPRLGIPSIVVSDGPAGVRIQPIRNNDSSKTYYATAFPVATLLASSWDTALVKKVGVAFGSEVREYGIDILLAPH